MKMIHEMTPEEQALHWKTEHLRDSKNLRALRGSNDLLHTLWSKAEDDLEALQAKYDALVSSNMELDNKIRYLVSQHLEKCVECEELKNK
jgi:hypothetical protein